MKKKTKKKKTGIIESRIKRDKNRLLKCLEESLGVVTDACLMANLSRETHYKWYSQDENYKKAVDDISDITLDFAENSLHKQIKAGNTPATTFFLKSQYLILFFLLLFLF